MIRINQCKINVSALRQVNRSGRVNEEELELISEYICNLFKVEASDITEMYVRKKSIDARKNKELSYTYSVDIEVTKNAAATKKFQNTLKKLKGKIEFISAKGKRFSPIYDNFKADNDNRPIVVGAGPAGLFCTYILAINGLKPILIEQGSCIEERVAQVDAFWNDETTLNRYSNVSFGEGGAGTFSDGKLNTSVKDTFGRIEYVKETFVENGAPEEVMYLAKPHIGTDELRNVIINIREKIIKLGGEVCFDTYMNGISADVNGVTAISVTDTKTGESRTISCDRLVLAIGHSARDTYKMLKDIVSMEQKDFAVGVRVQHKQNLINKVQYGKEADKMPAADYKLRYHTDNDRAVYSFCMCPGGYVVNASTEEGHTAINGMSNHSRSSENANSAIVVNVTGDDFGSDDVLVGVEFQRKLEAAAYKTANGKVPCQLYVDYKNDIISDSYGNINPVNKGNVVLANLREVLPEYINEAIIEAMDYFDTKISGFGADDVLLCGVETRTSAPVRIIRDETLQSNIQGIFPCGEGAGYAGGIMSAAVDGIKTAFALLDSKNIY